MAGRVSDVLDGEHHDCRQPEVPAEAVRHQADHPDCQVAHCVLPLEPAVAARIADQLGGPLAVEDVVSRADDRYHAHDQHHPPQHMDVRGWAVPVTPALHERTD